MNAAAAKDTSRSNFLNQTRTRVQNLEKDIESSLKGGRSIESSLLDLLDSNDAISMMLLWFLIDPTKHVPKLEIPFSKWPIPTVNLEFDHKGCWKEISSSHYFYEGAESKGTYDNCIRPTFLR